MQRETTNSEESLYDQDLMTRLEWCYASIIEASRREAGQYRLRQALQSSTLKIGEGRNPPHPQAQFPDCVTEQLVSVK